MIPPDAHITRFCSRNAYCLAEFSWNQVKSHSKKNAVNIFLVCFFVPEADFCHVQKFIVKKVDGTEIVAVVESVDEPSAYSEAC